jgi:hypothetical protein
VKVRRGRPGIGDVVEDPQRPVPALRVHARNDGTALPAKIPR